MSVYPCILVAGPLHLRQFIYINWQNKFNDKSAINDHSTVPLTWPCVGFIHALGWVGSEIFAYEMGWVGFGLVARN